jgi:hypothetical protein
MMPNSPKLALKALLQRWLQPEETPPIDGLVLASINRAFEALSPQRRIEQALELLPGAYVLTSSFGAQAAVMLHWSRACCPIFPWCSSTRAICFRRLIVSPMSLPRG